MPPWAESKYNALRVLAGPLIRWTARDCAGLGLRVPQANTTGVPLPRRGAGAPGAGERHGAVVRGTLPSIPKQRPRQPLGKVSSR
jgi:hypothetical protein